MFYVAYPLKPQRSGNIYRILFCDIKRLDTGINKCYSHVSIMSSRNSQRTRLRTMEFVFAYYEKVGGWSTLNVFK